MPEPPGEGHGAAHREIRLVGIGPRRRHIAADEHRPRRGKGHRDLRVAEDFLPGQEFAQAQRHAVEGLPGDVDPPERRKGDPAVDIDREFMAEFRHPEDGDVEDIPACQQILRPGRRGQKRRSEPGQDSDHGKERLQARPDLRRMNHPILSKLDKAEHEEND